MNIQHMLDVPVLLAEASVPTLEALRVVSDSMRHRILTMLIREALTPSQIAAELKMARTRVYYHLDLLKEHGFIRVVDERPVAAMTERTYRACAKRFKVERRMLAATSSGSEVNEAQALLLEHAADDLRAAPSRPDVVVSRSFVRLSKSRAEELRAAIASLVETYTSETEGETFQLTIALFASEGA